MKPAVFLGPALVATVALGAPKPPRTGPPPEIAGIWEVEDVATDGVETPRHVTQRGDPALTGRTFVLTEEQVQLRAGGHDDLGCKQSAWPARKTTWGFLLSRGFHERTSGGETSRPNASNFNLGVTDKQPATAYPLCPGTPIYDEGSKFPLSYWAVPFGKDRLVLRADLEFLLVLRRRPAGAKPVASFDCAQASTPTEKTICADIELASWDRSVSLGLARCMKVWPEEKKDFLKKQREYLKGRDTCGADAECIENKMFSQIEQFRFRYCFRP